MTDTPTTSPQHADIMDNQACNKEGESVVEVSERHVTTGRNTVKKLLPVFEPEDRM